LRCSEPDDRLGVDTASALTHSDFTAEKSKLDDVTVTKLPSQKMKASGDLRLVLM
jgi:hypothetical protein